MAIGMIAATRTVGAAILDATNSILCHLEEMRLNHLLVLLEKGDQSVGELEVGSGEEADDLAALRYREAARSGQALDIALDGVGQVVVDHILDARQSPFNVHRDHHGRIMVRAGDGNGHWGSGGSGNRVFRGLGGIFTTRIVQIAWPCRSIWLFVHFRWGQHLPCVCKYGTYVNINFIKQT